MRTRYSYVVVDDHLPVRLAVRITLDRLDWLAFAGEAADGTEGLTLLERVRPDLAIVDVQMPGIDGLQVVAEAVRRGIPTRIVLHSSLRSEAVAQAGIEAGASAWVSKEHSGDLVAALEAAAAEVGARD